jgi:type IV secretory pathway VirJ component
VAELEDWSHRVQRELGFERYRSPILAGVGAGATLAHSALAQSPAATLGGAIGADPAPALGTRVPLCPGAPNHPTPDGFAYDLGPDLPGFWREVAASASASALDRLRDAVEIALGEQNPEGDASLADLPLIEIPAKSSSVRFAVIYSGDGGWRDLDKQIGEYFAAHGTPTVGVDSLRYFWRRKTPEIVAVDLARIIRHYQKRWNARQVLLVGYSFGAGILPFAMNRLPDDVRGAVQQVSLLGLEPHASFEFAVEGWLGGVSADAPTVLPELVGAEVIQTAGGHHFDGDYPALARRILAGAKRAGRS